MAMKIMGMFSSHVHSDGQVPWQRDGYDHVQLCNMKNSRSLNHFYNPVK
jgi:hypothetical protein